MNNISKSARLKCVNCQQLMVSPVFLPCGCSICHRHTIDVNWGHVICCSCEIEHPTNGNQFLPNKALAKKIETQLARNQNPSNIEVLKICERFDEILTNIEYILNDPFNFANEAINYLENFVQLKGEEMMFTSESDNDEMNDNFLAQSEIRKKKEKLEIEKKMNLAFNKLDEYKKDCKYILKTREFLAKLCELDVKKVEARKELSNWLVKINEFSGNSRERRNVKRKMKMEIKKAIEAFEIELTRLKCVVLLVDDDQDRFTRLQVEISKHFGQFQIDPQFYLGY
jgi:predicted component of type VI protein secretion system